MNEAINSQPNSKPSPKEPEGYIPKQNEIAASGTNRPEQFGLQQGGEERATGVYQFIHDCRERQSQHSCSSKCEGYKLLGESVTSLPEDLYIPPNALKIFLETFSGPLDLLLYLIKKQNLDILDIPIAKITEQYMEYIDFMQELQLELVAEYLLMAAMLAEIKSKLLLPRQNLDALNSEEDPRAELVRRLQEYERYKKAAIDLDSLIRLERDIFKTQIATPDKQILRQLPELELQDLLLAFKNIMQRSSMYNHHKISFESLSVRERMTHVLTLLDNKEFVNFAELFVVKEGKLGVVVTFIAMLELLRQSIIEMVQNEPFGVIHLRKTIVKGDY